MPRGRFPMCHNRLRVRSTSVLDVVNTALATWLTLGRRDRQLRRAAAADRQRRGPDGRRVPRSRRHRVRQRVFSIIGGKLTEYRYMAQDALDRAVARAVWRPGRAARTTTARRRAVGSGLAVRRAGLPASLVARFGTEAPTSSPRRRARGQRRRRRRYRCVAGRPGVRRHP